MNLTDLDTFVHAAEAGTFAGAAEILGVPKSTVSRRVSRLEDELGVALLTRAARSFALTDEGRVLLTRCAPALLEIHAVEAALLDLATEPVGCLKVTAPPDIGSISAFGILLAEYRRLCPAVDIEVDLTNRVVDLIEEGYDVALRAYMTHLPAGSGLMARNLGRSTGHLVAGPTYLAERGQPTPENLHQHEVIGHTGLRQPVLTHVEFGRTLELPARHVLCNDFRLVLEIALANGGIAVLPHTAADPHLETGALVEVLPGWNAAGGRWAVVWPESRHLSPRVRMFLDLAKVHLSHL